MGNSRRVARDYDVNLLITFNCAKKEFQYSENAGQFFAARFDDRPLCEILKEDGVASAEAADKLGEKLQEIMEADKPQVYFLEMHLKGADGSFRWYCVGLVS
ncbi:MAG: hypothetical protein IJ420_12330, partial [Lachnospiraceae bacterium]|nr:hypothetical protein [Lachnospiraceae bacterium]